MRDCWSGKTGVMRNDLLDLYGDKMALENGEPVQNIVEITMTEEEAVFAWAAKHNIMDDAVEKLIKEGFSSLAAIKLLEMEDLAKTKILRGQQKL